MVRSVDRHTNERTTDSTATDTFEERSRREGKMKQARTDNCVHVGVRRERGGGELEKGIDREQKSETERTRAREKENQSKLERKGERDRKREGACDGLRRGRERDAKNSRKLNCQRFGGFRRV